MGTPEFAVSSLEGLINSKHKILAVVTQPDKPRGRGKKIQFPPVKQMAIQNNIEVYQPKRIKDPEFIQTIKDLNPDVIIVIAYGKILPKEILSIPKKGCINVHASLLPAYRGAAPINWAIIKGEKKTGITTMYMDEGLDTGDIILQREIEISDSMTAGELHDQLSELGREVLLDTLSLIENNQAPRISQEDCQYSYAPMIDKRLGKIDWNRSAKDIVNLIRGVNPWPGAYTFFEGRKIKIWEAKIYKEEEKIQCKPGTVLKYIPKIGLIVKSGKGLLAIQQIQVPNYKKMDIDSYMNGHNIPVGTILESNGSESIESKNRRE